MKNNGLFCTLFLDSLKNKAALDDAAQGRMASLIQKWRTRDPKSSSSLWESFMKQAVSYLEFVPEAKPAHSGVYRLFDDYSFSNCITLLHLVEPGADIDDTSIGRFHPAKLLARLRALNCNWGILTDGNLWRLYSLKSSRPYEDYVELALNVALENSDEAEYGLFERFFHRDSFIADLPAEEEDEQQAALTEDAVENTPGKSPAIHKCRLDSDRDGSEKALDDRVKKPFLAQVDEVLRYICNGFISDTPGSGAECSEYTEEERTEIFESAVKLIYRCLFLFYAEARRLLPTDPDKADLYTRHSMKSLCLEAQKFRWGKRDDTDRYDLWKHLKGLVGAINDGDPEYGIMGYDGGLFDDEEERFLGAHQLRNDFLSKALYLLAFVEPNPNEPDKEYAIPYEDLEVRHLGELYENILEYTVLLADGDRLRRRTKKGTEFPLVSQTERLPGDTLIRKGEVYFGESALERKQTGSYYTPESLVRFLNEKAIVLPLAEIFDRKYRPRLNDLLEQAKNGHDSGTRLGAAHSAAALIERFAEEEVFNYTICDPAMGSGHFLVDATNQAAGLMVALLAEVPYIEGMKVSVTSSPNDWRRRITRRCIYGVDLNPLAVNLAKLSLWLNCFAARHKLTFLDHHLRWGNSLIGVRSLDQLATIPERKSQKKKKKDGQLPLFGHQALLGPLAKASASVASISRFDEDDTDAQKAGLDEALETISSLRPIADLYTAYLMDPKISAPDYRQIFQRLANDKPATDTPNSQHQALMESVQAYRARHSFFHWPLEFPDVFGPGGAGGFSATVGNPPWDIVKPNSQEFFSDYDPEFRSYDKQKANRVSADLMNCNPAIVDKWKQYCEGLSEQSTYFKEPLSYIALGKGDINTFKLFLEQFFTVLKDGGRMGIVVPSGIYTDQGCQPLRELFFSRSRIEFLYCFENRWPTVFSAVDGRFKFVTFCTEKGGSTDQFKCAFMEHDPERLPAIDSDVLRMSVKQVKKFSPDSLSVMEFKSQRDIDVTARIYGDWPLLGEKLANTWNVTFRSELHMTNHSHLFKTSPTDCPLYEGKMISLFDSHFEKPRYWLEREVVKNALGGDAWEGDHYRVGLRDIASSTNQRTLISSLIPRCFHGNKLPTVKPENEVDGHRGPSNLDALWLTSSFCSFVLDYIIRRKVSATLNFFYLFSLPVPRLFDENLKGWPLESLIAKALRLTCVTAEFAELWNTIFLQRWRNPDFWYPGSIPVHSYGPAHEQEIRRRLRDEAKNLTPEWTPHCGVHDRLPDRRDTGDRAQLRAEIDAYVAHVYGLSRDDFSYILDTFPVLRRKEEKAFGEFMSKRKCLEEFERIGKILERDEQQRDSG